MRAPTILFWGALAVVALPAVMLTLVRVFDPSSGLAVQLQSFTPFALPAYAVALVLVGLASLRAASRRRILLAPAILAVAGLGLHAWWFAPQVVGAAPQPDAGADPVVVMTANLSAGEGDGVALVGEASEAEADLLVVTEVTDRGLAEMEGAGLRELLPFRAGLAGDAVEGTMVFAREPVDLIESLETSLDSLVVTVGGRTIIAVHPSPPVYPGVWRADHAAILAAAQDHDPDLIVGDFNAAPDHPPMRELAEAGYRDSVEVSNAIFQPTWPANGGYPVIGLLGPTVPIDHILVSDALAVLDTRTAEIDGTDHRLVIAEVAPVG